MPTVRLVPTGPSPVPWPRGGPLPLAGRPVVLDAFARRRLADGSVATALPALPIDPEPASDPEPIEPSTPVEPKGDPPWITEG